MSRIGSSAALILTVVCLLVGRSCANAQEGTYPPIGALSGSTVYDVAVSGAYAYLVGEDGTSARNIIIRVVDVSDPTVPAEVARFGLPGDERAVAVDGAYLYVASGSGGLRIIDISDPLHPFEVSHWTTPRVAVDVAVAQGYAYVADAGAGVRVIDVSDPATPAEVGFCNPNGQELCIAVAEPYAYVGYDYGALGVMDIQNPAAPFLASYLRRDGAARGVAVAGSYAYLANGTGGLRIIDVSDPAELTEVAYWGNDAKAVAVAGGYAYVAAEGLRVVDVTNPSDPVELGFWDTSSYYQYSVAVADGYVYLASGSGLVIFPEASFSPTRIRGQVRIAGTTTALEGVTVEAYHLGELQGWAVTRSDGAYAISDLSPGEYVVVAHKYGYVTLTQPEVTVIAEATTTVDLDLQRSARIRGQVRERGTTTNLANASVFAYLNGAARGEATTDNRGIYLMDNDLPSGDYVVVAAKAGYLTQTKAHIGVVTAQTTYVNFWLDLAAGLKGQVTDGVTGQPVIGAYVSVWQDNLRVACARTQPPWALYTFGIDGLAPGTYTVWASAPGYLPQSKWAVTVTADAVTYRNFRLQPGETLAIKGQVRDRVSGSPIVGATVTAYRSGVFQASATTVAPWGVYEVFADLPEGTYVMQASAEGHDPQTKVLVIATPGLTAYVNFSLQPQ